MPNARLPTDDLVLEMEETEGLLISPPKQQQQQQSKFCSILNFCILDRWGILLWLLGFFLGMMLCSNTESLRFWEGKGGENVDNVEIKAPPSKMVLHDLQSGPPTSSPTAAAALAAEENRVLRATHALLHGV